jgi:hypothetical protein
MPSVSLNFDPSPTHKAPDLFLEAFWLDGLQENPAFSSMIFPTFPSYEPLVIGDFPASRKPRSMTVHGRFSLGLGIGAEVYQR